jgi:hypothetical protein
MTLWIFWAVYVLVMGLYRAHLQKRIGLVIYILGSPFILFGMVMDFIINFTVAAIVFVDLPREPLVTGRLQRYVAIGSGWRFRLANWTCNNLLDVFDPSGNHC